MPYPFRLSVGRPVGSKFVLVIGRSHGRRNRWVSVSPPASLLHLVNVTRGGRNRRHGRVQKILNREHQSLLPLDVRHHVQNSHQGRTLLRHTLSNVDRNSCRPCNRIDPIDALTTSCRAITPTGSTHQRPGRSPRQGCPRRDAAICERRRPLASLVQVVHRNPSELRQVPCSPNCRVLCLF